MTDSYHQVHGGAEPREGQTPRNPSEENSSRRVPEQQPQRPTVIYTHSPKTIHVEAHDFKEVVQRLTGKDWYYSDWVREHSAAQLTQPSHSSRQSQEASDGSTAPQRVSSTSSRHALEDYLNRLDRENPSPKPSLNRGLFPTAGLVKGVDLELGLRWGPDPGPTGSSAAGPSGSCTLDFSKCKDNCHKYIYHELGIQFSTRCCTRDI